MKLWTALIAALACAHSACAAPPIAAYGQLPGVSNFEISPDGTKWAAVFGDESHAEIQIRDRATRKLITVSRANSAKVRGLQWVGPDHLLATVSTTAVAEGLIGSRHEWYMLLDYNLKKGKWNRLLTATSYAMNVISGDPTGLIIDGKAVVVVPGITFPGGAGTSTLFRIDLDSAIATQTETGAAETDDWIIGPDGKSLARADYVERTGEWRLYLRKDNRLQRVYTETALLDPPYLSTLGSTGETILVSTAKSGVREVHEVSIADGSWSPPRADLDTDSMIIDPTTRHLIGTMDIGLDNVEHHFFAPSDQSLWRGLAKAFPGEVVRLASWSDDRKTIIVEVEGPTNGDAFFIVDRRAGTADWLADRYPGITADDVAPTTAFRYKAADGLEIPAYLTVPRGPAAKNLPLVVLAHGGPESRDNPGFDWWAQALASRGYAVLQPQFRGSSGFGKAHRDAGYGQWGRKMQTDLSDGVRHLAANGSIDPKRVCIVGGSYGGYAALAGPTLDPGLYRCASAVAGVADLRRMLGAGSTGNFAVRYWSRYMGTESAFDKDLKAFSPAQLVDRVTVPIQLIHGKEDTVVPYDQSVSMNRALRGADKSVEFITLPGEDHWLSRAPTRIAMLTAMVAFLEKHNPPQVTQ